MITPPDGWKNDATGGIERDNGPWTMLVAENHPELTKPPHNHGAFAWFVLGSPERDGGRPVLKIGHAPTLEETIGQATGWTADNLPTEAPGT